MKINANSLKINCHSRQKKFSQLTQLVNISLNVLIVSQLDRSFYSWGVRLSRDQSGSWGYSTSLNVWTNTQNGRKMINTGANTGQHNKRSVGRSVVLIRFKPIHLAQSFAPTIERASERACVRMRVTCGRAGVWVRVRAGVHPCGQKSWKIGSKSSKMAPPMANMNRFPFVCACVKRVYSPIPLHI